MKQKKKIRNITLTVASISIVAVFALVSCGSGEKRQVASYEYITGTSLWDLSRNCPKDMDKRDYISVIMELNAMDTTVVYADKLYKVPIYEW